VLDILLIPAALLLALALQAVRRGDHRLHGHLMTAGFTMIGLRLILHPRNLPTFYVPCWLGTLAVAGATMLLGRMALAWRESRTTHTAFPRIHRAFGAITLIGLALTTLMWLLRDHG
jgi:uncharacterized membrane protein YozB (DUF420 family)